MATITIHDFLSELTSFIVISDEIMNKAKESKLTSKNGKVKHLLVHWSKGTYDEDVDTLVQELKNLL